MAHIIRTSSGNTTFVKKITVGVPARIPQILTDITNLEGIDTTGEKQNDILIYDSASGNWIPQDSATLVNLTLTGNLTVEGETTTLNTTVLDVEDKNITLAKGITNANDATGAGISVDFEGASLTYDNDDQSWNFNRNLNVTGNLLPSEDSAYNLGSSSAKWKDLFLSGSTIHLGGLDIEDQAGNFAVIDDEGDPVNFNLAGSVSQIRGFFSSSGDLSYDSSTGIFSFDVEQIYTTANFESDLGAAIEGGTGITYDSDTDTISITDTGVIAGEYGSETQVPIITVNAQGQIDSIGEVLVAGVTGLIYDSSSGLLTITTADGNSFTDSVNLNPFTTSELAEGTNLYYTTARADSDAKNAVSATDAGGDGSFSYNPGTGVFTYTGPSASEVRSHFSAQGDLSYDSTTGVFQFDVEDVYTKANFDSDFNVSLDEAALGGTGLTFDSSTNTLNITNTGVTAATYGSASQIPVFTVNAQGQLDSAGSVAVAGVTGLTYDSSTGALTISTADGSTFTDSINLNPFSTTDLSEGNNLYYTTARSDSDTTALVDKAFVDALNVDAETLGGESSGQFLRTDVFTRKTSGNLKFNDGLDLIFGNDDELTLTTNGNNGFISQRSGDLLISAEGTDADIILKGDGGSGFPFSTEDYLRVDGSTGGVKLYGGYGNLKLETTSTGITVTGSIVGNYAGFDSDFAQKSTSDLSEGSNLYYTTVRVDSDIDAAFVTKSTDNLSEGSTNLYYTSARADSDAKNAISLTFTGGDGAASYTPATGVISVTGPSAAEVRAHLSGGTGVTYTSGTGQIAIGQSVGTTDDVTFGQVTGDSFSVGEIAFQTDFHDSHIPFEEGALWYDPHHKNLNYYTDFDHPIEIGMQIVERVYNNNAYTINKGQPLYYSGNRTDEAGRESPTVALANATSSTKYNVQGLSAEDIPPNQYGQIVVAGVIDGFDTSGLTAGLNFFAGLTDGSVQNAAPTYPNYPMCLGWVIKSDATDGKVIINQQNHSVNTFRVQGDTHIGDDLIVDGNLTVNGTQTITSTENVQIGGNIQYLNGGDTIGETGTSFVGSGLDDAFYSGHYSGDSSTKSFFVKIDATGTPDTFEWGFDSSVGTEATGVAITGEAQLLDNNAGISIDFGATTGHTVGDKWTGTATALNTDTGLFSNKNEGDAGNGYTHVGVYWDASQDEWTFVGQYDSEPEAPINRSASSFAYGDVRGKDFYGTNFTGALVGNADTATEATNVTVSANNSADETVYLTFVDGATGTQGIETDTGLSYNPSTGLITTTSVTASGAVNADSATLTKLTVSGVNAKGVFGSFAETNFPDPNDRPLILVDSSATMLIHRIHPSFDAALEMKVSDSPGASLDVYWDIFAKKSDKSFVFRDRLANPAHERLIITHSDSNAQVKLGDSSDLFIPDKGKILLGNDNDLQIFHNEANSFIRDDGTGALFLQASRFIAEDLASNRWIDATASAQVELNYNGAKKFETTSTGVDITGELQADTLDIDGNADISGTLTMGDYIVIPNNSQYAAKDTGSNVKRILHLGADDNLYINQNDLANEVRISTNNTQRLIVTSGGDVKFDSSGAILFDKSDQALEFGDNYKATFGSGGDFDILFNGTNQVFRSNVADNSISFQPGSTGNFNIFGGGQFQLKAEADAEVSLWYNGTKRIETTDTGVTVTGSLLADSATISGDVSATTFTGSGANLTNLPAGNLTGTIDSARIPSLAPSDIHGTFATGQIPSLAASKITSGVFDSDRIPTININGGDADTLDGIDGASFLRSDAADTKTSGDLTFNDDVSAFFGTGSDLEIYHQASSGNSFIQETGSGSLKITASQTHILNAANNAYLAKFLQGGAVELNYDGTTKVKTDSDGMRVAGIVNQPSGIILEDPSNTAYGGHISFYDGTSYEHFTNGDVVIGGRNNTARLKNIVLDRDTDTVRFPGDVQFDSAGGILFDVSDQSFKFRDNHKAIFGIGSDLQIYHDGSNSHITDQGTGDLTLSGSNNIVLKSAPTGEYMAIFRHNSNVELRHNNIKKFETTTTGATITGEVVADSATIDIITIPDGSSSTARLNIGTGDDLKIYHDASNSYIDEDGTGHLYIRSNGTTKFSTTNSGAYVYYNGSNRLQTTSSGVLIDQHVEIGHDSSRLTSITETSIASFAKATYSGGKFIITALDHTASQRQITELLVVHNGDSAYATEYGTIYTDGELASFDVDISGTDVRILATSASTNATTYQVAETLMRI